MPIVQVFLWLITYSFVGWAYESALRSIMQKRLVNSGFLTGPICPIYGFGALSVILALYQKTDNLFVIFIFGMILTCSVEYITSILLEKIFHAKWWDYSKLRFNFQGRVSLIGAVIFGALSVILIRYVHPFVSRIIDSLSEPIQITAAAVIFLALFSDTFINVHSLLRLNGSLKEIQSALNSFQEQYAKKSDEMKTAIAEKKDILKTALIEKFEESEFFNENIKKLFIQNRTHSNRIARAFPKFKHIHYDDAWQRLKSLIIDAAKK